MTFYYGQHLRFGRQYLSECEINGKTHKIDVEFYFIFARRILTIKSADEFYCKMGTLSGELLNGHLFDSNGLIQRIVDLGPIADLQRMREKHLFNVTPWKDRKGLR